MGCGCNKRSKPKISGIMARRKMASIPKSIMPAIESTVGFLGSKFVNKINLPEDKEGNKRTVADSPNIAGVIKLAAGIFLSTQKNNTMKNVGNGIIIAGFTDLAKENIPQLGIGRMAIAGPSYRQYALRNHVGNAPYSHSAEEVILD